jgi:hypothetical protein
MQPRSPIHRTILRRFWSVVFAAAVLGGCKIEQTPREFIDHRDTALIELQAAEDELRARLHSAANALRREDADQAVASLSPAGEIFVYGLTGSAEGPGQLRGILSNVAEGRALEVADLEVVIGPRNQVGWFRTELRAGAEGAIVRFSGVFVRMEGEWRLLQGHLSQPLTPVPDPDLPAVGDIPAAVE